MPLVVLLWKEQCNGGKVTATVGTQQHDPVPDYSIVLLYPTFFVEGAAAAVIVVSE